MSSFDLFPFLQQSPLLAGFSTDGVRIIQSIAVPRQIDPGAPIFVERMHGESAFLLVAGEVALSVERGGAVRELGTLGAPEALGELSLLHPGPRRVTARARTVVGVIELARRDFVELQAQRPQACAKLILNITERFAERTQQAGPLVDRLVDLV
jgi:CRP-like cAMP-binding protein